MKPPPKSRYQNLPEKRPTEDSSEEEEEEEEEDDDEVEQDGGSSDLASEQSDSDEEGINGTHVEERDETSSNNSSNGDEESAPEQSESDHEDILARVRESVLDGEQDRTNRKRKRTNNDEELEDVYMRKLAREEVKEEEQRQKKQKTTPPPTTNEEVSSELEDSDGESYTVPKHETQLESTDTQELEKAARTVFLGNVSSEAITSKSAKKTLLRHLASFIDDMPDNKPPHKVESLRFRSTAFGSALPKKAAFAKKQIMDSTTKSTNAYAVYSTQVAAREAAKRLNGTVVLDRHIRVDSVAHPSKVDHRRCVFVGNLGFVDDESNLNTKDGEKKKKSKTPGDVEEGLWEQFGKAGKVESVRVVRDSKTRVGKGIAYVQFEDENAVEAALQFDDQKFPPLLPRKLRVARAKAPKRKDKKPTPSSSRGKVSRSKAVYNAKISDEQKTNQGRARAMLGKAGASQSGEAFVFEGHRASSKQGHSGLKLGGKKKGGKPMNRGSKRAAAWKKSGGRR